MTVKVGFIKHPGKSIGKFGGNIGQGLGDFTSNAFVQPITQLTDNASDFINSPIWYIALGGGALILLTTIVRGTGTANRLADNPEAIRALSEAAQQMR